MEESQDTGMDTKPKIGFIGQGYVGKNYADDFESRGYSVVRYALEDAYRDAKDAIAECPIVFVAVPTPSTPDGFNLQIVESVLDHVGEGNTAVVKSTLLKGSTKQLQKQFPDKIILYSPEFLSEATASQDAANPFSNIIGIPEQSARHKKAAEEVHAILPKADFVLTCDSTEAEIIKYAHNINGYVQVVLFNMLYDLAQTLGADWEPIERAIKADPYIPNRYARPLHKNGRGAGGNCFVKDFAAFERFFAETLPNDEVSRRALAALREKNLELLINSGKDLHIIKGVYGPLET